MPQKMKMVIGKDDAQSSFRRPPMMSYVPQSKQTPYRNTGVGLNAMFSNIRVNTAPNGGGCGCGK